LSKVCLISGKYAGFKFGFGINDFNGLPGRHQTRDRVSDVLGGCNVDFCQGGWRRRAEGVLDMVKLFGLPKLPINTLECVRGIHTRGSFPQGYSFAKLLKEVLSESLGVPPETGQRPSGGIEILFVSPRAIIVYRMG
jgi:hypothetical protein